MARLSPEAISGELCAWCRSGGDLLDFVVTGKTAYQTKNPGHVWCPGNRDEWDLS